MTAVISWYLTLCTRGRTRHRLSELLLQSLQLLLLLTALATQLALQKPETHKRRDSPTWRKSQHKAEEDVYTLRGMNEEADWLVGHSYSIISMCQVLSFHLNCWVFGHVHTLHQLVLYAGTQSSTISRGKNYSWNQIMRPFLFEVFLLSPSVLQTSTPRLSSRRREMSRWSCGPPRGKGRQMRTVKWRVGWETGVTAEWVTGAPSSDSGQSPSFCGPWCAVVRRNQDGVSDQNLYFCHSIRVCLWMCSEPQWADSSPWGCRISAPVWWTLSGDPGTFFSPHPALPSELHSPETQPAAHTLQTHTQGKTKAHKDGTVRVYLRSNADCSVMLPSCAFSCSSKRAESFSVSLQKLSFSVCRACSSLKTRENEDKQLIIKIN